MYFSTKKNPLCKFEVLCLLKKRKRRVSFGMHGEKGAVRGHQEVNLDVHFQIQSSLACFG